MDHNNKVRYMLYPENCGVKFSRMLQVLKINLKCV